LRSVTRRIRRINPKALEGIHIAPRAGRPKKQLDELDRSGLWCHILRGVGVAGSAGRAGYRYRSTSVAHIQVHDDCGQVTRMVNVQMREQNLIECGEIDAEATESFERSTSAVYQNTRSTIDG
jgi:hypothetical protein